MMFSKFSSAFTKKKFYNVHDQWWTQNDQYSVPEEMYGKQIERRFELIQWL